MGTPNTDLTVFTPYTAEGEWIGLDAYTDVNPQGRGVAYSRLYDEHRAIGHALQSLFIDRLQAGPLQRH